MTKIYFKLIAMTLALLLSVSVLIMSSYAWMVLSSNPAATGIQVVVGGGNTILVAPNVSDSGYNYPGYFSDKLNFGSLESYNYLRELGGLTPVSTSNGIDWFMPEYYSSGDEEVFSGKAMSGDIKDVSQFKIDSELLHANLKADEKEKISKGNYIYLDFWVVSPNGDYTLRVSTGDDISDGGSFVANLPKPEKTAEGYTLSENDKSAAAAVRIGFLANDSVVTDETMQKYQESKFVDKRFSALKGIYVEPNSGTPYFQADKFTVYEPNGDFHPQKSEIDGTYVNTKPLALNDGIIEEVDDFRNSITVQLSGNWVVSGNSEQTVLEQKFQTALRSWEDAEELEEKEIYDRFYREYLQGQISPYYRKGLFVKASNNLKAYEGLKPEELAGATEDVFIVKLEQGKPQRIRMFVWLEGQDIDCTDGIEMSRFVVNIEFAGGSE